MRIAIWLHAGIGGGTFSQGQPTLQQIVERLSQEHDVTVYSVLPANANYKPKNFSVRTTKRWIKNIKIRYFFLSVLFLADHFKNKFEIIHAFWAYPAGTFAVVLGKIFGIPSVVTLQGGETAAIPEIKYGNMLHPIRRKITLWTCKHASCLNSISNFLIQRLQHHGVRRADVSIVPFGVDPNLFTFKVNRKRQKPHLHIIHVANLTEVKDQVTLLKAFKIISNEIPARLTIIGGDYLNAEIQRCAVTLQVENQVTFIPEIPQYELPAYYEAADMMMHTSLHEGLPLAVIEAMACGVVVCGTAVGILSDFKNQFFKTVEPRDFKSLANEVISLWHNPELYYSLQAAASEWAAQHDMNWTVRQYTDLYVKTARK